MNKLIAEGKAKPFIIVMGSSYVPGAQMGPPPQVQNPRLLRAKAPPLLALPACAGSTSPRWKRLLIDDLVPFIDANFSTKADQQHRAMASLAIGGMQTGQIGLAKLESSRTSESLAEAASRRVK
jgi:enterochelin esterase-like enzyme